MRTNEDHPGTLRHYHRWGGTVESNYGKKAMLVEAVINELENNIPIMLRLVAGVVLDEARRRPAPESWSVLEVVCHLVDEEAEDFRVHLEQALGRRPGEKWRRIDPQGWVLGRRYNERDLAEMAERWEAERRKSLGWLRGLEQPDWEAAIAAPWGEIRAGDLLTAWAAHDQLHLRQLVELRRERLLRLAQPFEARYAGDWCGGYQS